jgi:hypothetical protein
MRKSIYIEMGHHPQVILDTMEQITQEVSRTKRGWGLGCGGVLALAGAGILAFFLDAVLDYGGLFTIATFVLWGMALALGVMLIVASTPRVPRRQFEAAHRILYTLLDDTGRKGRVTGWLDLTGAKQKEKRIRTARSTGGKRKEYFRDPWFQVKVKLVDGNLLRLSLEDRVKTKAGAVTAHRTRFTAKLVVNPSLYRVGPISSGGFPLPGAALSGTDGIFTVTAEFDPRHMPVAQAMETLKVLYSQLQPMAQDLDSALRTGMEA